MPTTHRRPALTADDIVTVATALISEHGLGWFSMRKLAAALDVNPMTVYLRFESKDDLLDAVARRSLASIRLELPADGPLAERLAGWCAALRAHLIADRNLLALHTGRTRLTGAIAQGTDAGLALVEEAGYRGADAVAAFRVLFWHTVGSALLRADLDRFPGDGPDGLALDPATADPATLPALARNLPHFGPVDGDALFTRTTRHLVDGLLAAAPDTETP